MLRPLSPLSSGKYKNDLFFPFLPSPDARITVSRRTKESDFSSRALQLAFSPTTDSPRFSFAHSTPPIISTSSPFLFAAEAAFDFYETCNLRGDKEFSVVALALGVPLSLAISFALLKVLRASELFVQAGKAGVDNRVSSPSWYRVNFSLVII